MTDATGKPLSGSVMVIGGGIGGMQCALDLADTGFHVYLVEKSPTLGGTMARLDKTFPTNDCSTCMISPKLVQVAGHANIEILTRARLLALEGEPGRFSTRVEIQPRYVNAEKCIACGACSEKCPKKVLDGFNGELSTRKAAYLTFPQAVPLKYALDPENCLYLTRGRCGLCKKICPTEAIDFDQQPEIRELSVGALVLAGGFELALTHGHGEYGFDRYRNVVSSLQYERILSATGPYGGHIRRPSDGKTPARVAWIQCVLSRDPSRGRPFCSSVCCMHAAKQAVLTRQHHPETDATIYFMDVRAHGKGFDSYIDRAREHYGVRYRRSMISQVYLNPENDNLVIETFDHHLGRKVEEEYEMVVLSSGFKPTKDFSDLAKMLELEMNPYGFVATEFDRPVFTSSPGIFVCGSAETPKDIPETVIQAGAAAAAASALISDARGQDIVVEPPPRETAIDPEPRIGIFVCHCGTNIAGVVDIPRVVNYVKKLPHVAYAADFMFSCSNDTLNQLVALIQEHRLNRVVVAACSPRTHEPLFRGALREAGLNPYLFELASIRDQCSWVHGDDPAKATRKSMDLIRASAARAARLEPLTDPSFEVCKDGLVIGGGIGGMTAALTIADQGYSVHLVEKEAELGGFARDLTETLEGNSPAGMIRLLKERVVNHRHIRLYTNSRLTDHGGHMGAFSGTIRQADGTDWRKHRIDYGAVIVATGGQAYEPREYLYGQDPRVMTQVQLARRLKKEPHWARSLKSIAMIQCVGSRNEHFTFCSRVCCSAAVKNSIRIKELNPAARVTVLYRDVRTFGFKELYYLQARRSGVLFFRFIPQAPPVVSGTHDHLKVDFTDRSTHQPFRIHADLLVLSTGIRPNPEAEQIGRLLKLPVSEEGFFLEAHVKLRPVEMATPGVFLAGLAHSPRFIEETLTMARSAGQQAVKILSRNTMTTSAAVAEVDADRCTACLVCVRVCPYGAPYITAEGVSCIPPSSCMGCGICTAECPAGAISLKHSTDSQILSKIEALLAQA